MKGIALAGIAGSLALVTAAVVGRDRWHAAQANIRRYSMPGARSYDLVAGLLFRSRYGAIAEAIATQVPAGSRLLDVGCGPGEVLNRLATIAPGIDATGLDVDAAMIGRARRKAARAHRSPDAGPRFVVADVAAMPFPDASFDVVVSSYAVHHWPDRQAGIAEVMRVLKPGGRAIVWDVAPPHPTGEGATSGAAHGHGHPTRTAPRIRRGSGAVAARDAPDAAALPTTARRALRLHETRSLSRGTACAACDHPRMVEYGNGIGHGAAGQVGGSGGGGGGAGVNTDWSVQIGNAASDAWNTFTALPAWEMALIVILLIGALVVVRRAL